ncbi:hypothetical protein B0H16DRAFT_1559866 [Mycena metata]|uniref:Uncharacterized protein n=1 Tax=Mycena metata TaxID=1033252 RepID=A0AAD7ILU7_9AGAR|nr:hypothetical protein B0H16DRAFT_1559866 [Mycena metata]
MSQSKPLPPISERDASMHAMPQAAAADKRPAGWKASVHPLSHSRPPIPMQHGAESSMAHPNPHWQHGEQSLDDSHTYFPGSDNNRACNLSIGVDNAPRHSTPHSRNTELPNVRQSPGVRFASRSEHILASGTKNPRRPTPPSSLDTSDSRPVFFRPDSLADRAIAAATKCRHLATTTIEALMPCEYLLSVTQSMQSCSTLYTQFASLAVLVLPPQSLRHHKAWHQRHTGKLEGLVRYTPNPRTTTGLAKKLEDYTKQFTEIQNSIQRSWIRLETDITDDELAACRREIEAAIARFSALQVDQNKLSDHRYKLLQEFKATPGHP